MNGQRTLFSAGAIADASGFEARPGAALLEAGEHGRPTLLASGRPQDVDRHPGAARAQRVDLPTSVLMPALVNAHCHLDLTAVGPKAYDGGGGFTGWIGGVLAARAEAGFDVRTSIREGIRRSLAAGVMAVGDIAGLGRMEPFEELSGSPLMGASFVEFFGMGARQGATIEAMENVLTARTSAGQPERAVRLGLQPHAPYSAGIDVYRAAGRLQRRFGVPLATHIAESADEVEFVADGTGPMRDFLERLGVWDESILDSVGRGRRPVEHLIGPLAAARYVCAHANTATDVEIEALARTATSVVFCPRAWRQFGHGNTLGPHRWRDMLREGINVAVGTDSVINLPPEEAGRIGPLDDLRLLWRGGERDAALLFALATVNGATALGLTPELFMLSPPNDGLTRAIAGVAAVETGDLEEGTSAISAVLSSNAEARLLAPDVSAWLQRLSRTGA